MAQTAAPKQLFGNTLNLKILLLFFFFFPFSAISQKSIQHVSFGWMGNKRARVCEMQTLTALLIKCHSVDRLLTNSSGAFDLSTQIFQRGDRKVQTRLKYSAASLWLIREAQLWIYWWHLTVGHKGGGGGKKNHIISCFYIFHFWLLFSSKCTGVCRRQLQKCWQKQNKKKTKYILMTLVKNCI